MTARRARKGRWLIFIDSLVVSMVLVILAFCFPQAATTGSVPPAPNYVASMPTNEPSPSVGATTKAAEVRGEVEPQTLTIASLGFDRTPIDQMEAGAPGSVLSPPVYDDPASWWRNFAPNWVRNLGAPGRPDTHKTHILGHSCTRDCLDPSWLRFNRLAELKVGEVVTLGTSGGDIRYVVTASLFYDETKRLSGEMPRAEREPIMRRLWDQKPAIPEELQLIACSESVPGSGNFNLRTVVFAERQL